MADRFPFLRIYKDMAAQLSKEDRADFYDALIGYALDGEEPEASTGAAVFQAARRMVDKWRQTSAAGKARASKTAGRSLDGRWQVAGSEKPADGQKSKNAGSEKPAKEEKDKRIKEELNNLTKKQSNNKYSECDNKKAAAAAVRAQDVIDLFNEICISLPKVRTLTDTRRRHIKARLRDNPPATFRTVFEKTEASDFLTGRLKAFRANFDWIVGSPEHWAKILEGVYDNRRERTAFDAADRVADALIGSADPEAVAEFERSMNGGYKA